MTASGAARQSPRRKPSAFGPALFALSLIFAVAIYAWSVLATTRGPQDWLMILPAAAICVAALVWAGLADTLREIAIGRGRASAEPRATSLLPPTLILLVCAYAPGTALVGFDVATAIFIGAVLVLQGERRPLPLALATLGGTALLVWIFTGPLAVRLPTMLM